MSDHPDGGPPAPGQAPLYDELARELAEAAREWWNTRAALTTTMRVPRPDLLEMARHLVYRVFGEVTEVRRHRLVYDLPAGVGTQSHHRALSARTVWMPIAGDR